MTNYGPSYEHEDDRPSLSMDERIVWISDNGPEYGYVRWLGKLSDLGTEWMAGVEFDNPVGSGTGLYRDTQLFVTPLNHASLVPVIGLLKASDFDVTPEPKQSHGSGATTGTRLIDFGLSPTPPPKAQSDIYESSQAPNFNDAFTHLQDQMDRLMGPGSQSPQYVSTKQSTHHQGARVRQIHIQMEGVVGKNSEYKTNSSSSRPSSRLPELPSKPKSNNIIISNSNQYPIGVGSSSSSSSSSSKMEPRDITTTLRQISLSESPNAPSSSLSASRNEIATLPAPALVVPPGDRNPALTLERLLGKSRGIQGHNNSCYLDSTLFAMFSSTTIFDSLLYRPPTRNDIPAYKEIQRILREAIVKPLREDYLVHADQVMLFREMLEQSSSVEGLTDEEKDPEEFLTLLLGKILKAEPYLKLSSGLESFLYQLIVDKDESVVLPTVQDLFDQSFVNSTVRLREIPPCLLMHMPRHGRQFKMYPRIMPSPKLDITDVLESAPRSCDHRGKDCDNLARIECKDCLHEQSGRNQTRLASITYCHSCFQSKHFGKHATGIEWHDKKKTLLNVTPSESVRRYSNKLATTKDKEIPRIFMDLFAVLCIETSHYVCFVKCGTEPDSPWCFFDSMADRKGEQNGYNIPEVLLFDEFAFWTSDDGISYLLNHKDDKLLPEMTRRLICDAYVCFYQYNGLTTYR